MAIYSYSDFGFNQKIKLKLPPTIVRSYKTPEGILIKTKAGACECFIEVPDDIGADSLELIFEVESYSIAPKQKPKFEAKEISVPASKGGAMYKTSMDSSGNFHCTCVGFGFHSTCKHLKMLTGEIPIPAKKEVISIFGGDDKKHESTVIPIFSSEVRNTKPSSYKKQNSKPGMIKIF